jgi:glycosyltransferase involved in cell wall biosynthesis
MECSKPSLKTFTPLPPEKNGIADYASILLNSLQEHYDCSVLCDDIGATAPAGIPVLDQAQAFRHVQPGDRVLHQIGNNQGHVFVLRALRQFPGVTTIHDIGLFYLYEMETGSLNGMLAQMEHSSPRLAATYGRQWKRLGMKTAANYALFDMQKELLDRSTGVVVHSHFAKSKLQSLYGAEATRHVSVIPHFAPPIDMLSQAEARSRVGLPADAFIVVTSGFATRAKRFDWVMAALEHVLSQGTKLIWIHAGEEREHEYALSTELRRYPLLSQVTRITGYVDEDALNAYISACDLLLNLRFPSVGESSGSLARAFSAGRCCVVSDTASYRELPRDAVIHLPVLNQAKALAAAVGALHDDRELLHAFGENARRYAETALSMQTVARQYAEVIEEAQQRTLPAIRTAQPCRGREPLAPIVVDAGPGLSRADLAAALRDVTGTCDLLLKVPSLQDLADLSTRHMPFVGDLLPDFVETLDIRILSPAIEGGAMPPAAGDVLSAATGIMLRLRMAEAG